MIKSIETTKKKEVFITHTPSAHNARAAVHEYRGGPCVMTNEGSLYINFLDHSLYYCKRTPKHAADKEQHCPLLIYPPVHRTSSDSKCHFADFRVIQQERYLIVAAIMEHQ